MSNSSATTSIDFLSNVGSLLSRIRIAGRTSGCDEMSWNTIVGKSVCPLFRPGAVLEKKKAAANQCCALHRSAIDCASAVFPEPAGPCIIIIDGAGLLSPIQAIISSMTASRVLG